MYWAGLSPLNIPSFLLNIRSPTHLEVLEFLFVLIPKIDEDLGAMTFSSLKEVPPKIAVDEVEVSVAMVEIVLVALGLQIELEVGGGDDGNKLPLLMLSKLMSGDAGVLFMAKL